MVGGIWPILNIYELVCSEEGLQGKIHYGAKSWLHVFLKGQDCLIIILYLNLDE